MSRLKFFFLILTLFPYINGNNFYNVGTTLFHKSDTAKKCWSESDKDLLVARRIMQDLLPQPDLVDFSDPLAIPTLLEYFRTSFILVKQGSSGQTQQHLLLALADSVGGYLRSIVLPVTRAAYYAGRVSYDDTRTMTALYEDLKVFLKTTGNSWKAPDTTAYHVQFVVTPLEVSNAGDKAACDNLLIEEEVDSESESEWDKRKKRDTETEPKKELEPELALTNSKQHPKNGVDEDPVISMMPLPLLDNEEEPKAIGIPWKDSPLISLSSKESAYIIPKYYSSAIKCIASKSHSKEDIINFNTALYNWITNKVLPHLDDEAWYVGFGGVLRVIESIKSFGVDVNNIDATMKPDGHYMFGDGVEIGKNPHQWPVGDKTDTWASRKHHLIKDALGTFSINGNSRSHLILLATFMILLTLVCCMCCCCAWCKRQNKSPRQAMSNFSNKIRSAVNSFHSSSSKDGHRAASSHHFLNRQTSHIPMSHSNSSNLNKSSSKSSKKSHNSPSFFGPRTASLPLKDEIKSQAFVLAGGDGWSEITCPFPKPMARSQSFEKMQSINSSSIMEEETDSTSESGSSERSRSPSPPK